MFFFSFVVFCLLFTVLLTFIGNSVGFDQYGGYDDERIVGTVRAKPGDFKGLVKTSNILVDSEKNIIVHLPVITGTREY